MTYIGIRQATLAQWVALRPIFEVCTGEKGYEGGGLRRDTLWRQEAAEKQLRETLAEAREERSKRRQGEGVMQWEPEDGRRRVGSRDAGSETSNARVGE